jgi:hypothetical protein
MPCAAAVFAVAVFAAAAGCLPVAVCAKFKLKADKTNNETSKNFFTKETPGK